MKRLFENGCINKTTKDIGINKGKLLEKLGIYFFFINRESFFIKKKKNVQKLEIEDRRNSFLIWGDCT